MHIWAGWFDAGTATGALQRFLDQPGPQRVCIGAWSHGGGYPCSPYATSPSGDHPAPTEQYGDLVAAVTREPSEAREVVFFVLGAEKWATTHKWPPQTSDLSLHFAANGALVQNVQPGHVTGTFDLTASTGQSNRWLTQVDGRPVEYGDRRNAVGLWSWTSAPLESDLLVVGSPRLQLRLSVDDTDGAVFVYLEDVHPDGRVTYVTEGQLRLAHRAADTTERASAIRPYRNYSVATMQPMRPGRTEQMEIGLHPTAVRLAAGHRVRISLAGHDSGSFRTCWTHPHPRFHLDLSGCHVDLPVAAALSWRRDDGRPATHDRLTSSPR